MKDIVFDLGKVLIHWDPRNLYKKIFSSEQEIEYFLTEICDQEWNEEQDAGRSFTEGIAERIAKFPQYENAIQAYDERWEEMLAGPIEGSVKILEKLHQQKNCRLFALTNWSKCKFPIAEKSFPFLDLFEGIVVSGRIGMKKPNPKIYSYLLEKYNLKAEDSIFIDDSEKNIIASEKLGFHGIHFHSSEQLEKELKLLNLLT